MVNCEKTSHDTQEWILQVIPKKKKKKQQQPAYNQWANLPIKNKHKFFYYLIL